LRLSRQPAILAGISLQRYGRRAAMDREPSRFAAACLVRKDHPTPVRLFLPTRCGRGPSALRPETSPSR